LAYYEVDGTAFLGISARLGTLTPSGPTIHGFEMTNSMDHIVKTYNSDEARFYVTRMNEEHRWSTKKM